MPDPLPDTEKQKTRDLFLKGPLYLAADYPVLTIPILMQQAARRFDGRFAVSWFVKSEGQVPREHQDRQVEAALGPGWGKVRMTWQELALKIKHLGLGLIAAGVEKGDRFAIMGHSCVEWLIADVALASIGAVVVPIYPTLDLQTITEMLVDSEAKGVITLGETAATKMEVLNRNQNNPTWKHVSNVVPSAAAEQSRLMFDELVKTGAAAKEKKVFYDRIESLNTDDLFTIIYTSGSTGQPKGVMLQHRHLLSNLAGARQKFDYLKEAEDSYLSFLPLAHSFERFGHYFMLQMGSEITYGRSFDTVGDDILAAEPSLLFAVPRLFEKFHARVYEKSRNGGWISQKIFHWAVGLAIEKYKTGRRPMGFGLARRLVLEKIRGRMGRRLKFVISGGGALNPELDIFFNACGITLLEGYGLTEASPVISTNEPRDNKIGTVGRAFPNLEVRISEAGELWVRGPSITAGYYKKPQESRETFDADGWLHTGDLATIDDQRFIRIEGRIKDLIVTSGGKKIAPQKIEQMITLLPWVEQVCILGDKRPYAVGLVVARGPALDGLLAAANPQWQKGVEVERLLLQEAVWDLVEKDFAAINSQLAPFETIKSFALLAQPFSEEDGLLTPTRKPRRQAIEKRFADLLGLLYSGQSFVYKNNYPILPRTPFSRQKES